MKLENKAVFNIDGHTMIHDMHPFNDIHLYSKVIQYMCGLCVANYLRAWHIPLMIMKTQVYLLLPIPNLRGYHPIPLVTWIA